MEFLSDVSLVDGPFLWFSIACGAAGGAYLLWRRRRSWLLIVPASMLVATVVVALIHWILVDLMAMFSENLPFQTVAWAVPAVAALLLCAARFPRNSWRGRSFSVAAMLGVLLLCVVQINLYFGLNNTVSDLLGTAVARIQPLEASFKRTRRQSPVLHCPLGKPRIRCPETGSCAKLKSPGRRPASAHAKHTFTCPLPIRRQSVQPCPCLYSSLVNQAVPRTG
jgi:hypothetical protein